MLLSSQVLRRGNRRGEVHGWGGEYNYDKSLVTTADVAFEFPQLAVVKSGLA